MQSIAKSIVGLAGLGLLILAFVPVSERSAEARGSAPVEVTNTPLPVSVTNTPSVTVANSALSVTGNVAVANALDGSNNPVPLVVTMPASEPYAASCNGSQITTSTCAMSAAVPAGKRLVIQSVSFKGMTDGNGFFSDVELQTTVNGANAVAYVAPTTLGTEATATFQAAHHATTLYADPGTTPTCTAFSFFSSQFNFTCSVSGYLVPVVQ